MGLAPSELPRLVLGLPRTIGLAVYEFLFVPAAQAHPQQLAVPEPLYGAGLATRAAALHNMGDTYSADVEWHALIDWRSVGHRTAMLPREVLESLAWFAGLAFHAPILRRVVRREDLLELQSGGITSEHLQFVYGLSAIPSTGTREPDSSTHTTEVATEAIWGSGWGLLHDIARALPAGMAERMQIKLPSLEQSVAPQGALPALDAALFDRVRRSVVEMWAPEFDASLDAMCAT
jgi:hypothetical protein